MRGVSKSFGTHQALKPVTFDIYDSEFFTLLGPSGRGKTTLLRMLAGFEEPNEGQIFLHGADLRDRPPHRRRVNTVFQSYALFPPMTVAQNIAFGPENLGWDRARRAERVAEMLRLVHMERFAGRKPQQLSGGQRQRIALALKMRQAMRDELRSLQRKTGITFIFVTHDQEEAPDMSDRICVLGDGEVQQIGTPSEIYEEPANRFVANLIGETNFIDVDVIAVDGDRATVEGPLGVRLSVWQRQAASGRKAFLSIRPEKINLPALSDGIVPRGTIAGASYLGSHTHHIVDVAGRELRIFKRDGDSRRAPFEIGRAVEIGFAPESARVLGA